MTQVTGKVIPMPCTYIPQAPDKTEKKAKTFHDTMLALESLVTVAIGACALVSTTIFLFMCI